MSLYKVWDLDRKLKKAVIVLSFDEFVPKGMSL